MTLHKEIISPILFLSLITLFIFGAFSIASADGYPTLDDQSSIQESMMVIATSTPGIPNTGASPDNSWINGLLLVIAGVVIIAGTIYVYLSQQPKKMKR